MTIRRCVPYATRQEAAHAYAGIMQQAEKLGPDAMRASMAALGKADLFFFVTRVHGRADCEKDFIFDRCKEVAAAPDNMLDLWAREHYKSTIITRYLTEQDILCNPERTFGIFSHTKPTAKHFLREIQQDFENSPRLKFLYPDVLYENPAKESPLWSVD